MCILTNKAERLDAKLFQAGIAAYPTFLRENYFALRASDMGDIDAATEHLRGFARLDDIESCEGFPIIAYYHA